MRREGDGEERGGKVGVVVVTIVEVMTIVVVVATMVMR